VKIVLPVDAVRCSPAGARPEPCARMRLRPLAATDAAEATVAKAPLDARRNARVDAGKTVRTQKQKAQTAAFGQVDTPLSRLIAGQEKLCHHTMLTRPVVAHSAEVTVEIVPVDLFPGSRGGARPAANCALEAR
jgi:hypothetical protein